jgi:hypothetical protein
MSDNDYLATIRSALEESVRFFSPQNKSERECWVVREFLDNLGVPSTESELRPVTDDPPDVRFREANFEIKEILDQGRKRHKEYKDALQKARAATDPSDLIERFTLRDVSLTEVCDLILADATAIENKYPADVRLQLDLLFYVNLEGVFGLTENPFPRVDALASLGWRSVSFVKGFLSCVLCATRHAPDFIQDSVGRISHRVIADAPP